MNERIMTGRVNIVRNEILDSIIQKWWKEPTVDFIEDRGERSKAMHFLA